LNRGFSRYRYNAIASKQEAGVNRSEIMPVRAVTAQLRPGETQEIIDLVKYSVLPVTKAQKGFRGFYEMNDASSGKYPAISVWETETGMMAREIT